MESLDERIARIRAKQQMWGSFPPPCILTPRVWLGSAHDATDIEWLNEHHITHVINCAESLPKYDSKILPETDIQQVWVLDADDDPSYPILAKHLDDVIKFLNLAYHNPDARVLIHCRAGMNRSPALALAAVVAMAPPTQKTRLEIFASFYEAAVKQRPFILQNEGFYEQLLAWAHQEN